MLYHISDGPIATQSLTSKLLAMGDSYLPSPSREPAHLLLQKKNVNITCLNRFLSRRILPIWALNLRSLGIK